MKKLILTASALMLCSTFIAGCGEKEEEKTADGYAKEIYLYNWSEYMSQEVLDGFEEEYGIKVIETTFEMCIRDSLKIYTKKQKTIEKIGRTTGIIASICIGLTIVATLCNMVIPELYTSIRDMVYTVPDQLNEGLAWLNEIQIDDSTTGKIFDQALREGTEALQNWLRTDLLSLSLIHIS